MVPVPLCHPSVSLQNGILTLSKKRADPQLRQAAVTSLLGTQGRFHNVGTDLRIPWE